MTARGLSKAFLKIVSKGAIGVHDIAMGLVALGFMTFALYWLFVQPLQRPFGLVVLTAPWERLETPKAKSGTVMTSISENDIAVTELGSSTKGAKKLTQRTINYILKDKGHRIDNRFAIPADLKKRVEFWFKIYALYTVTDAVVHDNAHPWIIYDVVSTNSLYRKYRSKSKRNATKAKMIRSARYRYINILSKLSKRKHYRGLTKIEKRVYTMFKDVKGSRRKVFAQAKKGVRVQKGQKDSVIYAIKKSGRYLDQMEKIFAQYKLPKELTRIPFLESSFNLKAYSKDGASGVWQFMSKTGRAFLNVSHAKGIDERNDPVKSTHAAARLLTQNYKILKSWPLAVTAYNHGPGGLLRGIRRVKSRNLNDLIEKYKHSYFGFASKNYYAEFLAMVHAEMYQDKVYGTVKRNKKFIYDDIEIKYAMRVKFIMNVSGVTQKEIKKYNPDLRNKALSSSTYLPEGYYLKLPKGKTRGLVAFYKEVDETNRQLDKILGKERKK